MKNIAVFCGSNSGSQTIFSEFAFDLGCKLAERNIGLVYGGAKVGLMGAVADGVLSKGGKATGVIPSFLKAKELQHNGLDSVIVTETMHERKAKMYELSDAIISLPGGFGTLDEMFEFLTWGQLALHKKPTGLLNVNGYYNDLLAFVDTSIKYEFVKPEYKKMLIVDENIDRLLDGVLQYNPCVNDKWFVTN